MTSSRRKVPTFVLSAPPRLRSLRRRQFPAGTIGRSPGRELAHELVRRPLPTVALDGPQRPVVPLLAHGRAGISYHGDEIAEIAGVTRCGLDALVRDHAAQDQIPLAEVAQDVVDVGRYEHA